MKNKQPIFQSFLLIFFVFGMVQTVFSQTIDEKSKVILDKVEAHYSSYETMRYEVLFIFNRDTDDEERMRMTISTDNKYLKVTSDYSIILTDGKTTTTHVAMMETTETEPFDENMNIMWFSRIVTFCQANGNISFVETTEFNDETVDIIEIESLDEEDGFGLVEIYVNTKTSEIVKFIVLSEEDAEVEFFDFEANPTFPDDYFEIKE